MLLQVAHRMEDHRPALTGVSMHPENRLLRHHPGGQENRGRFGQQPRDHPDDPNWPMT